MSSRYESIPIDSDHENDEAAEPMIEDDTGTEHSRTTDRYHFFQGGPPDSDEEPEEDPPETNHRVPLPTTNTESRPLMRQTARIRATMPDTRPEILSQSPMPNTQPGAQSQSSIPTVDPYDYRATNMRIWGRTLRTLQRWRDKMHYAHVPSEDGSSVRQEFLMDTTPIVVDKLTRHEEKLDMIEDIVMDMPGHEQLGELTYRVDDAEDNIVYVNNTVQDLKRQVKTMTEKFKEMKTSVEGMEREMGECSKMTAMAQALAQTSRDNILKNDGM